MTLDDFFVRLGYGELSNLAIGEEAMGTVAPSQEDKLVVATNHALTQIFSRFLHKRTYVKLVLDSTRQVYKIVATEPALVFGPGESFPGAVIKITDVARLDDPTTTDTDEAQTLGINRRGSKDGIKIIAFDTIEVDAPLDGETLRVDYQGRHPELSLPADLSEEIEVHPALEEALELCVAARIYSGMNGQENLLKARELRAAYEEACNRVSLEDLLNESETESFDKLRALGFL